MLSSRDAPIARADLAQELAAHEPDEEAESGAEPIEDLAIVLHHVHLPKLADAGVIEYDPDDGTITYVGHPALNDDWLNFPVRERPRASLMTAES